MTPLVEPPTRQTYAELQQAYSHFNKALFEGSLPECLITLQREKRTCGYFSPDRWTDAGGRLIDEIALNPAFFAVVPIMETMQTLVHEMVHQWQKHHGSPGRGRYHNDEWAKKMESVGLMPSSTGKPGGKRTGDQMMDYAMDGGRFIQACIALLTDNFSISWYDRFPDESQVRMGADSLANQGPAAAGGGAAPSASNEMLANTIRRPVDRVTATSGPGNALPYGQQTRVKYRCPCGLQVWGKPNLRIRCLQCELDFASVT